MHRITFRNRIENALPAFVILICVLQPLLDIAGYWQAFYSVPNTVTLLIRGILLAVMLITGYFLTERRPIYWLMAGILALHAFFHALACLQSPNGYRAPVADLVNLLRIYYLPLITVCLITFLRRNKQVFPAMLNGLVIVLGIIFLSQILSFWTGTNPYTYPMYNLGTLGWFLWTNSQSAILGMLCPLAIMWAVTRSPDRIFPAALMTAVGEAALFLLAPRLAFASLAGAGLGCFVCIMLNARKAWKQALAILLITGLFLAAYPYSPTYYTMALRDEVVEDAGQQFGETGISPEEAGGEPASAADGTRDMTAGEDADAGHDIRESGSPSSEASQTHPSSRASGPLREASGPDGTESGGSATGAEGTDADALEEIYRHYYLIWTLIERFGRERVFEAYHYTLDPAELSNVRQMKIVFCRLLMEDSGTMSMLFGLNLKDMTYERYDENGLLYTDNFDVENDFHGIYFLTGLVGLGLMLAFLLLFGFRALFQVLRSPARSFTPLMAGFAMAYGIALVHAFFTACLLRRTNGSIHLAIVLAGLWYLSRSEVLQRPRPKHLRARH